MSFEEAYAKSGAEDVYGFLKIHKRGDKTTVSTLQPFMVVPAATSIFLSAHLQDRGWHRLGTFFCCGGRVVGTALANAS